MVSSEAESEGSVLSEVPRDQLDAPLHHSIDRISADIAQQDKPVSIASSDWKTIGSNVSSFASSRGLFIITKISYQNLPELDIIIENVNKINWYLHA